MKKSVTRDGREFVIRRPTEKDAAAIIKYSKILFASTDQVLTTQDEYSITVENEKIWINNFNQNEDSLVLVAELDEEIAGLLFFMPNTKKKNSHTGEFGVSVHPDLQRQGIGKLLIETLMAWAKENVRIEKVYLNVFATNTHAVKLYERLGFREEGRHVKAVKQLNGEYVDVLQMYIFTK
jgi:RimJ/RimL family protein N-acetyltransferase